MLRHSYTSGYWVGLKNYCIISAFSNISAYSSAIDPTSAVSTVYRAQLEESGREHQNVDLELVPIYATIVRVCPVIRSQLPFSSVKPTVANFGWLSISSGLITVTKQAKAAKLYTACQKQLVAIVKLCRSTPFYWLLFPLSFSNSLKLVTRGAWAATGIVVCLCVTCESTHLDAIALRLQHG